MSGLANPLIIGGDSKLGQALLAHLRARGSDPMFTTRKRNGLAKRAVFFDLENDFSIGAIPVNVSTVFLFAAVSSLKECFENPEKSRKVNVQTTFSVINDYAQRERHVIFPSTNLVFDGSAPFPGEMDSLSPKTEYGRQKAEIESLISGLSGKVKGNISIVRFTKILEPNMRLLKTWAQDLRRKRTITPLSDMVMAPVPMEFAVHVLNKVATSRMVGTFNVSGDMDVSYEEVARYIATRMGVSQDYVKPVSTASSGIFFEANPSHTVLNTQKMLAVLGLETPKAWNSIEKIVDQILMET